MDSAVELPKVLVTGFPNSGTSFLCELAVNMGFSPGSNCHLKPADEHNPHGYWEHRVLYYAIEGITQFKVKLDPLRNLGVEVRTLPPSERLRDRIAGEAEADGVEIFKHPWLPVFWRSFPRSCRYLLICRDWEDVYRSGGYEIPAAEFRHIFRHYWGLATEMCWKVPHLWVRYEDFRKDFDGEAERAAKFLGVAPDISKLRRLWRPGGTND